MLLSFLTGAKANIFIYLQAEDITKSAQYYLRLMHFRQIYKVLGMQMEETDEVKAEAGAEDTEKAEAQVQG